jgi:hypothetical protein
MNIRQSVSFKQLALSKANTQMVAVTAIAAFITVLCLGAANYFMGISSYQAKIITADKLADNHLRSDVVAKNQLVSDYRKFGSANPNILGTPNQSGSYIYNNATIILNALPSQYDFPALISSIQALLQKDNFNVTSIGGTDNSASVSNAPSNSPQPVSIPFSFSITNANYQQVQQLFTQMQEAIQPLQVENVILSGTDSDMTVTVNAQTYFQPAKEFKIGTETIQ